jgi:hypothetical protein
MVTAVHAHDIGWLAPSPMWSSIGSLLGATERETFVRPAILRFAHDAFMDELLATLAYHPHKLHEWRATYETWEKPMAAPPTAAKLALHEPVSKLSVRLSREAARRTASSGAAAAQGTAATPSQQAQPLKLYQPVQQRHYLITASLVCRTPGLPDRRIDAGKQERAAFVLRRIIASADATAPSADPRAWDEYAFVETATGSAWQRVKADENDTADKLLPGEERLPLFSVAFDENAERKRRLFAGLIPVGRREAYVGAGVRADTPGEDDGGIPASGSTLDPRLLLLQMRVTAPWSELVQQSLDEIGRFERPLSSFLGESPPSAPANDAVKRAAEQAQTISWYVLLDLERFLHDHLPRIWGVLAGMHSRSDLDVDREEPLLAWLEGAVLDPALRSSLGWRAKSNLLEVLTLLAQDSSIGEALERVEIPYDRAAPHTDWPDFLFPLADAGATGPLPFTIDGADLRGHAGPRDQILGRVEDALAAFVERVGDALPADEGVALPEIHLPSNPKVDTRTAWFAIRCVYERPNCGPFEPPAVSEPTELFQMASFFDPEAPARPVRIPMPLDISPAGLRKFNKSATLQISDMLCGQLKRIRKMTLGDLVLSVLPWPFHKDLPDPSGAAPCKDSGNNPIGMFCSLSIPIVTICALVLMIIIVSLFDIFFRWLPYLFMCLPIPGFKGKRG